MREKELRLALICYGGISLAVYMHGITKEVWRLARASQAFHSNGDSGAEAQGVYHRLLSTIADEAGIRLRVLVDILTGASAGGINAIFLGQAITTGHSLEPLTELWLENADVDRLIDPAVHPVSRFAKSAAVPIAWALSARRGGTVEQTVEASHRDEVRRKLANFVRGRWFSPPFSGPRFSELLLDAFDAMEDGPAGPPLLPHYQPLDLFVTVTDFRGHPQRLRLHSPPEVLETEHRITLSFRDAGGEARQLADPAELVFAARATASFPGAFPPFTAEELDGVLKKRAQAWPGREKFLERVLPRHAAIGEAAKAVLIDGSVLADAPFGPAIGALERRPARREVDRRFVYIDPKPGLRSVRLTDSGEEAAPGFFATIFGALSDIPREQPIRDNLEQLERRSSRIRRLTKIVEAMRPEVEAAIERAFGHTFLLSQPTPSRIAGWRSKAHMAAARESGYAYAAYGHLKLSTVAEEAAAIMFRIGSGRSKEQLEEVRLAVWNWVRAAGLNSDRAITALGARADLIEFLRNFDLGFRTRRLRFLARTVNDLKTRSEELQNPLEHAGALIYDLLSRYHAAGQPEEVEEAHCTAFLNLKEDAHSALSALAAIFDLKSIDDEADVLLTKALASLPRPERRILILAYLGYPFYDIATLPLLQGEGLDEFDPVKVDRIAPDDAASIREGGAEATLKGIQFNSFGAFFSRAYRENDYLWGRLHGAERLIDITLSALPPGKHLPPGTVTKLKRDTFRGILKEERERLTSIGYLFDELEKEIG
jgi:patatin-related protein